MGKSKTKKGKQPTDGDGGSTRSLPYNKAVQLIPAADNHATDGKNYPLENYRHARDRPYDETTPGVILNHFKLATSNPFDELANTSFNAPGSGYVSFPTPQNDDSDTITPPLALTAKQLVKMQKDLDEAALREGVKAAKREKAALQASKLAESQMSQGEPVRSYQARLEKVTAELHGGILAARNGWGRLGRPTKKNHDERSGIMARLSSGITAAQALDDEQSDNTKDTSIEKCPRPAALEYTPMSIRRRSDRDRTVPTDYDSACKAYTSYHTSDDWHIRCLADTALWAATWLTKYTAAGFNENEKDKDTWNDFATKTSASASALNEAMNNLIDEYTEWRCRERYLPFPDQLRTPEAGGLQTAMAWEYLRVNPENVRSLAKSSDEFIRRSQEYRAMIDAASQALPSLNGIRVAGPCCSTDQAKFMSPTSCLSPYSCGVESKLYCAPALRMTETKARDWYQFAELVSQGAKDLDAGCTTQSWAMWLDEKFRQLTQMARRTESAVEDGQ